MTGVKTDAIMLVTEDDAILWTDEFNYNIAKDQLYEGWDLKRTEGGNQAYFEWMKEAFDEGT